MTRTGIKKAFAKLDITEQAEVLGDLASAFAISLADFDRRDAQVFNARRNEESNASPLSDVKCRLKARRRRLG